MTMAHLCAEWHHLLPMTEAQRRRRRRRRTPKKPKTPWIEWSLVRAAASCTKRCRTAWPSIRTGACARATWAPSKNAWATTTRCGRSTWASGGGWPTALPPDNTPPCPRTRSRCLDLPKAEPGPQDCGIWITSRFTMSRIFFHAHTKLDLLMLFWKLFCE